MFSATTAYDMLSAATMAINGTLYDVVVVGAATPAARPRAPPPVWVCAPP